MWNLSPCLLHSEAEALVLFSGLGTPQIQPEGRGNKGCGDMGRKSFSLSSDFFPPSTGCHSVPSAGTGNGDLGRVATMGAAWEFSEGAVQTLG